MINELIKLSTHLDAKGLKKESDYLDAVIKQAQEAPLARDYNNLTADLGQLSASIGAAYDAMPMNAQFPTKIPGGESFNEFHRNLSSAREAVHRAMKLLEAQ